MGPLSTFSFTNTALKFQKLSGTPAGIVKVRTSPVMSKFAGSGNGMPDIFIEKPVGVKKSAVLSGIYSQIYAVTFCSKLYGFLR
jgi:hypothetical protein